MRAETIVVPVGELKGALRAALKDGRHRIGAFTSVDGRQLATLLLDLEAGSARLWHSPLDTDEYQSLSAVLPQLHWWERAMFDLFGLNPVGHPRLKPVFTFQFQGDRFAPLRSPERPVCIDRRAIRDESFMTVAGEGVYEIPVGPVHAGIIEPGHFRLSCLGEHILNLELRLGYLHRGVERRLTAVPWQKARFVAEAAASDTAAANALAHAIAVESLLGVRVGAKAASLRQAALECERLSMHVADLGGMAVDLGLLGMASALSRLRGTALRLCELLARSRFLRAFICPGGVSFDPSSRLGELGRLCRALRSELLPVVRMFLDNQAVYGRLHGTGVLPNSLARDFGVVGVAARGSGIAYDARVHFPAGGLPAPAPAVESGGDALARTLVRAREIEGSLDLIETIAAWLPEGACREDLPERLLPAATGVGIVEAFRGELIHMIVTDETGRPRRYAIKDPSFNNWTGLAIAVRNNAVADFPVCNKSFALSYSGHDL